MKYFKTICKMSQKAVKAHVDQQLRSFGYTTVVGDGYVYAKGSNVPVLLTAHMDTVHKVQPYKFHYTNGLLSSPQGIGGDDRCGIWMILRIISETNLRPSILFCEDEEIGSRGAEKFIDSRHIADLDKLKFLVELDRRGSHDAVFYNCANYDFIEWIQKETGYKEAWGTFSDICVLSPMCGIASVNFSCGYYKEHTLNEYVNVSEMRNTKDMVIGLLERAMDDDVEPFEYIEWVNKYGGRTGWEDDDYYYPTWSSYTSEKTETKPSYYGHGELYIMWNDKEGNLYDSTYYASSLDGALVDFFTSNADICYNDIVDYEWY